MKSQDDDQDTQTLPAIIDTSNAGENCVEVNDSIQSHISKLNSSDQPTFQGFINLPPIVVPIHAHSTMSTLTPDTVSHTTVENAGISATDVGNII